MALSNLKVIEFAGLAPGPFAGMVLADNGASVIRVDRPSGASSDVLCRGKRSIVVNSKVEGGRDLLRSLIASADVVIDPFRPGVMERLGLGPEVFLGDGTKSGLNEKLIYARIVGFPREGPYKDMAGHDINYAALSGALSMLPGTETKPTFPLNILSDFAGGGIMCAVGILLALLERGKSGKGQVVNTDMVTGTRYISTFPLIHSLLSVSPLAGLKRGTNLLDGGAPFYNIYVCKDGGLMSVGCLEPEFFKAFLDIFQKTLPDLTIDEWKPTVSTQSDRADWPKFFQYLEKGFSLKPRDEWADIYMKTEACTVPILTPREAGKLAGTIIPEAHPKIKTFSDAASTHPPSQPALLQPGRDTNEILDELNISASQKQQLVEQGALDRKLLSSTRPSKL